MACSTGCPTPGEHRSYGECLRAKTNGGICTLYVNRSMTADDVKLTNRECENYRRAYREGIEPDGTRQHQIDRAVRISNETGVPYKSRR